MTKILDILNDLENTASTNQKIAIVKFALDKHPVFRSVVYHALNPYIVYGIKKIPEYTTKAKLYTLGQAIGMLEDFSTRKYTGNAAIKHLTHILESLDSDDAIVIERILQRDLRCGVADSLVNSAAGEDLIPVFDVMLCHKDTSGIKYPAIAQEKGDGCLSYSFVVKTIDGDRTIGDIVDSADDVYVLSYNHNQNVSEFKRVLSKMKNKSNKQWFVLTLADGSTTPPLTGNHLVYCVNRLEYVRVDELTCSDFVQMKPD